MALYGAGKAPAVKRNATGTTVATLTEDGGATISGTNDGDLPDLTTITDAAAEAAIQEIAQKLNDLIEHLNDGRPYPTS